MSRKRLAEVIDGTTFKRVLNVATGLLEEHVDEINRLNVFPVPDGDTGTNMLLTMNAVIDGLEEVPSSLLPLLREVSQRALLGARGNSGVILAQFLAGFASSVDGKDKQAIDVDLLTEGFSRGTEEAYRIVSHPKEGTILTIMRTARDAISSRRDQPLPTVLAAAYDEAQAILIRTPEMLPVLKRAGVIDAGGLGFTYLLAAFAGTLGKEPYPSADLAERLASHPKLAMIEEIDLPSHRYCTEFIVEGKGIPQAELRAKLADRADSVLVLKENDLTHVHLHTDDPGEALQAAATYGRVFQVKVDDMYNQVQGFIKGEKDRKEVKEKTAVIAVSPGEGITEILRSIGASKVITGNPAVGEILDAISRVSAEGIILLPNDPNILLACKQAMQLAHDPVEIVASGSVPQGIRALLAYDPDRNLKENVSTMKAALNGVKSGSIGRAARASTENGLQIAVGDYVGILDGKVVVSGKSSNDALLSLLELIDTSSSEVITLFYGDGVERRNATDAASSIERGYPNADVQVYYGGQKHFDYIVSVE